ncbi:hypothetical protein LIER_18118 [Lithospermum erythrorhizon]|uniref:Uncharacterized protein n=1 Tax=Lithospermum erythrorhizon TaxID=34254 RepID=A0AAV3QF99_LITER
MSQSSENKPENFELRPRGAANQPDQAHTSIPKSHSANPLANTVSESAKDEAARMEKAYQGIMAFLPTFVKNSTPPDLTDDQLDDELVNMASSQAPQLVDFNDMLMMDRPSLFTRVAITTQTKPRELLIPEAVASSPLASGVVLPTPSMNPRLKRMASDAPPTTQPLKKAKKSSEVQKKKKTQPIAHGSSDEGSRHLSAPAPVEAAVNHPPMVTLDSSTTVSDQDMGRQKEVADRRLSLRQELSTPFPTPVQEEEAGPSTPRLPRYSGLYLAKPFSIPNLEVADDSPWGARKFHFHLTKPLLSKELTAPYSDLVDPYTAFAQTAKYFNQAINGAFVLAHRADLLAVDNNSLHYKVESLKKNLTIKRNLNLELAKKCKDFEAELKGKSLRVEELQNLPKKREWPRLALLRRYGLRPKGIHGAEIKRSGCGGDNSDQARRYLALASAAAKAESARITFANSTLHSFISSPAYEKKVGSECAAYFHSIVASTIGRFPDLAALFKEEAICCPEW